MRQTAMERKELERGSADAYLARMVDARRAGRFSDVPKIMQEAKKAGVHISPLMVKNALRAGSLDISKRTVRDMPKRMRADTEQQRRGIETLFPKE